MTRTPDMTHDPRSRKLEWYANTLASEAVSKEKSGKTQEAMTDYLKAAEILLLLAKNQDNYTVWKSYSDRAIACHQRVKTLIATQRES